MISKCTTGCAMISPFGPAGLSVRTGAPRETHRRPAQPITTVTVAPDGLNVRCTRGLPGPCTVTVTVAVSPAASVPDIGATMTFFSRPAGSETDQLTLPPVAVSVIKPLSAGATSSQAGLTLSVPAPGGSPVPVLVLVLA